MKQLQYLLAASLCFLTFSLRGQFCQSIADGDFYDPSIWSTGVVPTSADTLVIRHDITSDSTIRISAVYVRMAVGSKLRTPDFFSIDSISIIADQIRMDTLTRMQSDHVTLLGDSTLRLKGTVWSDGEMRLSSFENWMSIYAFDSLTITGLGRSTNHKFLEVNGFFGALVWDGSLHNAEGGLIGVLEGSMIVGDTLYNQSTIFIRQLINDGIVNGDSGGDMCVRYTFINTGSIIGTHSICDGTPGEVDDDTSGFIGPDVRICDNPCIVMGLESQTTLAATLYPVPATETVSLKLNSATNGECQIISMAGQALLKTQFCSANQLEIDVSTLPPGIYSVQIQTQQGRLVKKLVIQ